MFENTVFGIYVKHVVRVKTSNHILMERLCQTY